MIRAHFGHFSDLLRPPSKSTPIALVRSRRSSLTGRKSVGPQDSETFVRIVRAESSHRGPPPMPVRFLVHSPRELSLRAADGIRKCQFPVCMTTTRRRPNLRYCNPMWLSQSPRILTGRTPHQKVARLGLKNYGRARKLQGCLRCGAVSLR
jgi:hypothetical protein